MYMVCPTDVNFAIKVLEHPLRRDTSDGSNQSEITIKFALAAQPRGDVKADERQATDAIAEASQAVLPPLGSASAAVGLFASAVSISTNVATVIQTFDNTWGLLMKRMELFNRIVAGIAQVLALTILVSSWSECHRDTDSPVHILGLVCHVSCEPGLPVLRSLDYRSSLIISHSGAHQPEGSR